jgi:hypothetical protein
MKVPSEINGIMHCQVEFRSLKPIPLFFPQLLRYHPVISYPLSSEMDLCSGFKLLHSAREKVPTILYAGGGEGH